MRDTLVACLFTALSAVAMANRDSGWQQQASEQQLADDMATCDADPKCAKLRDSIERGVERRKTQAAIEYEQKPWWEKAFPWVIVAALVVAFLRYVSGSNKAPDQ